MFVNRSYFSGIIFVLFLLITLAFSVEKGICQSNATENENYDTNRGAQYYLGHEDELLIKVNVWGFVARPGQYLVPSDTDLISLLSFVGGPTENANLKKIKIVRTNKDEEKVIKVNVKSYLNSGKHGIIPDLLPGDTIIVPSSRMYLVNKFFEYASRVAIVIQMAWYVTLINNQ